MTRRGASSSTLPQRWTAPTFPLRAADFIARGLEKGPGLGAALARSEEAWIAAGFPMERKALDRDRQSRRWAADYSAACMVRASSAPACIVAAISR